MKLFREKKNSDTDFREYIYETLEQRTEHVKLMESKGHQLASQQKRILKKGVFLFDATEDDFDWYAKFKLKN